MCLFQLMDIDKDGFVSMMDQETNEERQDLKVPEGDVGQALKDAFAKEEEQGILVRSLPLPSPPLPPLSSSHEKDQFLPRHRIQRAISVS